MKHLYIIIMCMLCVVSLSLHAQQVVEEPLKQQQEPQQPPMEPLKQQQEPQQPPQQEEQRRQLVVADIETLQPVAGANVQGKNGVAVSDSAGRFAMPGGETLVVSHVNYESRIVNTDKLSADTVWVISKLLNVKEVVVFGQKPTTDDGLEQLRQRLRMQRTEAQLQGANPNMNLVGLVKYLIPKKWRKTGKQKRHDKVMQALEKY